MFIPSSTRPFSTRREVLALGGGAILGGLLKPARLRAEAAPAFGPATAEALKARGWSAAVLDSRLVLSIPEVVENGANAPIDLSLSGAPEGVYVKRLGLYAEANFTPEIAVYGFSPATGAPMRISVRARLAESQSLFAVAELSDGALWAAEAPVKVAIGGCAG